MSGCDHGALSPEGTVVVASFGWHDGRRFYYASCTRCGRVLTRGACGSAREVREAVRAGLTPGGEGEE